MKSFAFSVLVLTAWTGFVSPAEADTEAAELFAASQKTEPSAEEVQAFQDLDLMNEKIRRTRIALLSSTGAFGLGLALSIAGASQCSDAAFDGDLVCNTAGKALWGIGGPLLIGGGIAMLSTGIMLGVRQRKRRDQEHQIRRYSQRRLHWDLPSARLVF